MTVIRFFSDPHEGKELKSNTTPASRALLAEQLHLHALQAARMPFPGGDVHYTVCGGDLFDTDTNPEHILLRGAQVARNCNLVLGGNHDVANIAGRESSLSALAKLTEDDRFVMPPSPGAVHFDYRLIQGDVSHVGDVCLYTIPHHARQQEFDKALDAALADAKKFDVKQGVRRLLLVHCNYHLTFEAGENDLNLTDARARHLLQTFDFIIMGHDHRPRRECDGRLIVLGNTHPTSFSDLGEKLVWFYDSKANAFSHELNCGDASLKVEAATLLEDWRQERLSKYAGAEWIDIHGELEPEAAVDLAKAIRTLWKDHQYLYAIRASKVLFRAAGETDEIDHGAAQKTLIEIIEEQLSSSPDLLNLFREAKEFKE